MPKNWVCVNDYLTFIGNKENEIISGIYGIKLNNEIVYIGQSKNIIERCKQHSGKIIKPLEFCEKYKNDFLPVYTELRSYFYDYYNIKFVIIERIKDIDKLKERELYYINKYKPRLNVNTW